jgi:2-oxo-3-hexenedioate decarboxylase
MTQEQIEAAAAVVDQAAMDACPVPMLSLGVAPNMDLEDAYRIQRASIARRLGRAERLVGMKMGLTSLAKMEQVGVHEPIYGHLTSSMLKADAEVISHKKFCHPRVEPEICFVLGQDLEGPVTPAQAMLAVKGVCAALEVIDSRYKDFKFTLTDVVADNASSTRVVLGSDILSPLEVSLGNLGMVLEVNGEVTHVGSSAAIFEHPARSLAALANMLAEVGEKLHAGQIVMSGGATAAVPVKPGDHVRVRVEQLGSASLFVIP